MIAFLLFFMGLFLRILWIALSASAWFDGLITAADLNMFISSIC